MTAHFVGTNQRITQCVADPECTDTGRRARGMCLMHYNRWYKAGGRFEAKHYIRGGDPIEKLHKQSIVNERGCWVYQLSLDSRGYGRIWWEGKSHQAHRFAYLRLGEPFPLEFDLDHMCEEASCWNPAHIEPVPDRINLARGSGMIGAWARVHATCVCWNRDAAACPEHGQLHWRPDWRECMADIYGEVAA